MVHLTKAEMAEAYSRIYRENELYLLYLHDKENGVLPSATHREPDGEDGWVEGELYRPTGSMGGYVVVRSCPKGSVKVQAYLTGLEEANARWADLPFTQANLPMRLVLEKLTRARNTAT